MLRALFRDCEMLVLISVQEFLFSSITSSLVLARSTLTAISATAIAWVVQSLYVLSWQCAAILWLRVSAFCSWSNFWRRRLIFCFCWLSWSCSLVNESLTVINQSTTEYLVVINFCSKLSAELLPNFLFISYLYLYSLSILNPTIILSPLPSLPPLMLPPSSPSFNSSCNLTHYYNPTSMISPHSAHPNTTSQRKILLPTLSPYLHHHQNLTKLLEEKIQHLSYTILTLEDQLSICEKGLGKITCVLGINVDGRELTLVDKFALITQELVKVKTQSRVEIKEKEASPIYITKQIEIEKPVYITRQIEVEKPVYVMRDAEPIYITRQVQVERPVYIREEVEVQKQKVVYITKEVEVQIEKPIYITKLIEIQKPIYITEQVQVQKPTYITKQVYVQTPVYIDRVVEKPIIVERTIEKQTVCEKCQKIDELRDSVCVA